MVLALDEQARHVGQQLRIPGRVLTDVSLTADIEWIWESALDSQSDVAEQCAQGIAEISGFLHEFALSRLGETRERERRLSKPSIVTEMSSSLSVAG